MKEKYEFLAEPRNFLEKHTKLLEIIKKEYRIERFDDLHEKELEKIKWTNRGKERNFYTVLKILAENEPLTIAQIINLDPFHKEKIRDSSIQIISKMFNGRNKDKVTGLIEKNIIVKVENEYSIRDKYRLTLFGLFLAIEFFYNPRITTIRIITNDNSRKDIERSEKFLDSIAKNYTDYLPLIFTKWNVLKSINLNTTSLIKSILHPEPKIRNWMRTLSDIHLFTKIFNSDEKQITGMFYYDFICDYGTKLNEEQKIALGDKVMQEIKKILKIIKYKTQMEKLDVEINEDYIESATYSKLDKKITKMRKLEENPIII